MNIKYYAVLLLLIIYSGTSSAKEIRGAAISWLTYEAEQMKTTGVVMGPTYEPHLITTESSGQRCVKLTSKEQYIEFKSGGDANAMVIRYSLPDSKNGGGLQSKLRIYKNGRQIKFYTITSKYSMLYGCYPFTNNPDSGRVRNFYNELRIKDLYIRKGDIIHIKREDAEADSAPYCIIDLVDLENIPDPVNRPDNSLSIADIAFTTGLVDNNYTEAFRKCIAKAAETRKSVWIPPGVFKITGDITLPSNLKVTGAGMWNSVLEGDEKLYSQANRRIRLKGAGGNIHLSDFAVIGKLDYRNDTEANDGIVGSFGINSTISNIWIEHTKVGVWVENSKNLTVEGCRFRNTIADGVNFCVGMRESTIKNCTTRGTGDDCFAIWPAVFFKQDYPPGRNLITHCTGQLPFLANGAAVYGGENNKVSNCLFTDISPGSAILISTTFPTKNKEIDNNFSGTTVIENCTVKTSGGFDHTWDWRAAVEIVPDRRSISGINLRNLTIEKSLSSGLSVIAKNEAGTSVALSYSRIENVKIQNSGIGAKGSPALFISSGVRGGLDVKNSSIPSVTKLSENFFIDSSGINEIPKID